MAPLLYNGLDAWLGAATGLPVDGGGEVSTVVVPTRLDFRNLG